MIRLSTLWGELIMKKALVLAIGGIALAAIAAPAISEAYTDYTPQKGYWDITAVEVDPNHVDDYLAGLRRTQVPGFELLKKRGMIDDYKFIVRRGHVKGSPNVLIMTHSPSYAFEDPNKARDQALDKEMQALLAKKDSDAAVADYEKYRTLMDDSMWAEVTMTK